MAGMTTEQFRKMFPQTGNEPVTGALAQGLQTIAAPLNQYRLPESTPIVGGMSAADFTGLTGAQGVLQDFSKGNLQSGDMRMFDLLGLGAGIVPTAKLAAKGGGLLGREALRQMNQGTGILSKITPDPRMNILPPEKYIGKTLEGMPTNINMGNGIIEQFGTDQRIVDIAKQYSADKGLPYLEQSIYASVDPVRGKKIADAYEKMLNNPADLKVKNSYNALIKETQDQYEALRNAGYNFEFMEKGIDPYKNPRNAINDIILNKKLAVYPTEEGFGSLSISSQANPLLQKTGEKWKGKDVLTNDMFRAVHDVFGHAKRGVGFRSVGEENAYQSHAKMFSPEALPALASETRGQNSWVNFGKYGKQNQLSDPKNTIYANQKTGLLPEWAWLEGLVK